MNNILQVQFQRVETALNALIDSITTFSPSPAAALDLLSADDDLSKGLEELSIHQANHLRILSLRQTTETLDNSIRADLTLLASTRKELLATPATVFPPSSRDVPYNELLSYAKRISKFTVPPTFRPPLPQAQEAPSEPPKQIVTVTNGGTTTPAAAPAEPSKEGGMGVSALQSGEVQWLDIASQIPFVPWPNEDIIRRGALAQIQQMIEQGQDPGLIPTAPANEEEEKRNAEEEEATSHEREAADARKGEVAVSGAPVGGQARVEKPQVFSGLDLYDPDEE
ncbi:MAG: hypothetical protein M1835_000825 [Candelina submexicana]|nr:MAG: hypothetical protein M1835_000825 [Candelina submexicana]